MKTTITIHCTSNINNINIHLNIIDPPLKDLVCSITSMYTNFFKKKARLLIKVSYSFNKKHKPNSHKQKRTFLGETQFIFNNTTIPV